MNRKAVSFFNDLMTVKSSEGIYEMWQSLGENNGYTKSAIALLEWHDTEMSFRSFASNWEDAVLDRYFSERFFEFDLSANPLRRSSKMHYAHIAEYDVRGKASHVQNFREFVDGLDTPLESSIPIAVNGKQRLCFNLWTDWSLKDYKREVSNSAQTLRMCALGASTLYARLQEREVDPMARVLLSNRERECLLWSSKGERQSEIADRLCLDVKTVELHLSNARSKLDSRTTAQAVATAIVSGLIEP